MKGFILSTRMNIFAIFFISTHRDSKYWRFLFCLRKIVRRLEDEVCSGVQILAFNRNNKVKSSQSNYSHQYIPSKKNSHHQCLLHNLVYLSNHCTVSIICLVYKGYNVVLFEWINRFWYTTNARHAYKPFLISSFKSLIFNWNVTK